MGATGAKIPIAESKERRAAGGTERALNAPHVCVGGEASPTEVGIAEA